MEKKLKSSSALFSKRVQIFWAVACFATLIIMNSCKNKAASTLTKDDSINIAAEAAKNYKEIKSKAPKMKYLLLSVATQQQVFANNNDVKHIQYRLREYPGKVYGLDAYGVDQAGNQITGPFELTEVPNTVPLPLYWCEPATRQGNKRGHIKGLTDRGRLNQNVPMTMFQDLYFSPTAYGYSDQHNFSFYIITTAPRSLLGNPMVVVAAEQGYTNPAPPFNFNCPGGCDSESY